MVDEHDFSVSFTNYLFGEFHAEKESGEKKEGERARDVSDCFLFKTKLKKK
jgi:hypothetical protein